MTSSNLMNILFLTAYNVMKSFIQKNCSQIIFLIQFMKHRYVESAISVLQYNGTNVKLNNFDNDMLEAY